MPKGNGSLTKDENSREQLSLGDEPLEATGVSKKILVYPLDLMSSFGWEFQTKLMPFERKTSQSS